MMNRNKGASPFGMGGPPQGGGQPSSPPAGQFGGNASPNGNGWGQQFMQQFGGPPGQMKDQWSQFKTDNGFGGGMGGPGQGGGMGHMGGMGGQQMPNPMQPQMPGMMQPQAPHQQNPMQDWLSQRPQFGQVGQQPMDRYAMMQSWLSGRPRGLLGQ